MIGRVLKALPSAIKTGIKTALPQIKESGAEIIKGLKDGLVAFLPSSMVDAFSNAFGAVKDLFAGMGTTGIFDTLLSSIPTVEGVLNGFASVVRFISPVVQNLASLFVVGFNLVSSAVQSLAPVVGTIFLGIGEKIGTIVGMIQKHMGLFKSVFSSIGSIVSTVWGVMSPIADIALSVIDALLSAVEKAFPTIQSIIETVWSALEPIVGGITGALSGVGDAIGGIAGWVGDKVSDVGNFFGFAYGKDRVPYNNYPAILHEGEKVLTRSQADQYDRAMNNPIASSSSAPAPQSTGGNVINISKLAETVVIEKEADVDTVVAQMVDRFRQLVPNMA
jgi:phage-related protein